MTGLIIPWLLQRTIHFSGTLSCGKESWIEHVIVSQRIVEKLWMGLPLSKAHWGLLCVLNIEEMGATQKALTKCCKSEIFAVHKGCFFGGKPLGESPSLALISADATPFSLTQSCSNKEKL